MSTYTDLPETDKWSNQRSNIWRNRSVLLFASLSFTIFTQIWQSPVVTAISFVVGAGLVAKTWWPVLKEWNTWHSKSYEEINLECVVCLGWTAVYVGVALLVVAPNPLSLAIFWGAAATAAILLCTAVLPVVAEIVSRQLFGWRPR